MKRTILLLVMSIALFGCKQDAILDYTEENIVAQQGGTVITENGITLEIPAGAFENDGVVLVGKTGEEPTTVPNPDLTVIGEPFTLKLPVDTLLAPLTLSFPLPAESLTVKNGVFLLYNGTSYFPFEYEIIDGKVVVTIDTIDWEDISTKGKIAELLGFSLISDAIDDKVHIDERYLGIKEVSVVSGKVNYDDPASINSSSKILIFVHGLTGDPTGWEEYIKKIYQEPGRLSYTNIWTFGYHSDQDIDVRGGEFKRLLEQKINGRNPTIHIVAHSMGGLVSRSMLETHKGDNVGLADKLITLGTPHHGSPIEPIRHLIGLGVLLQGDIVNIIPYYKKMTQGAKDLNPESDFITRMRRSVSRNCSYYTIACKNKGFWAVLLRIPFFLSPNDGLVSVNSAKGVQGAESPSFDASVPVPMAHFYMRTFSHEDPDVNVANEELYAQVKEFLQKNEQVATPPSVTTGDITNITTTTASCSGNVTSDGGAAIIASGVCWSTSENPTVANSKTTDGADLGPYTSHITGLSPNTTYYVRAYATNAEGTAYGEEQRTFKTLPVSDIEYGSLTDPRDGNVYKTVTIGGKEWMAENLKYLPEVVGPATQSETTSCYYVYGYDGTDVNAAKSSANYQAYGVLYNWPAAMNGAATSNTIPSGVQGACPEGWHLPSDAEWKQMEMYLGMSQAEADKTGWRGTDEGGKMKHPGTEYWGEPNTGATNSSGFTALPGGLLYNGKFQSMFGEGLWWSSTQYLDDSAWWHYLSCNESRVSRIYPLKGNGLSLRCVRD